jgi:hypothetical protein
MRLFNASDQQISFDDVDLQNGTYPRDTEILNGWYFMSCSSKNSISTQLASKCSIMLFPAVRTSEIQLALFERVKVGEGGLDEVCCEPHRRGLPIEFALQLSER